ncbi:TRAP transporter small permease [Celeribacter arenosi]|uniref:TRAP transporter small permease protein n=1 Tax=Celeribacter arenosi TaxID=792649 RepID=A0ABP7KDN8_9RHOB
MPNALRFMRGTSVGAWFLIVATPARQYAGAMYWTVEKSVGWLARAMAVAGGVALLVVIALTCVSVAGRALDWVGLSPVPGDIELVEFGIGFAVFASLPYAQYARAHARVDVLQRAFGARFNRFLDFAGDLFLGAFTGVVAWRLFLGMGEKGSYGETTFILQIPLVWGYRAAFVACCAGVVVALFCVLRSGRSMIGGES